MSGDMNQVVTFGCRLNIYEGEVIKSLLKRVGVSNVLVFNSCAVTQEAERKLKQSIRSHAKRYPNKKIVVAGCASQLHAKEYAQMQEVDLVLGNIEKLEENSYRLLKSSLDLKNSDQQSNQQYLQKNGSVENGSVENDGVENGSVENGSVENDGVENGSVENDSVKSGSVENDGVENGSVENDGVENGSVENDSVENDGVENDSVENDGVENDGVENGSVENDGVENGSVENDSVENGSVENDGVENGSVENDNSVLISTEVAKLNPFISSTEAEIMVNDIMSVKETALHMIKNFEGKARAFVQVQNGCNHRCAFCIIPYSRGNSRSVSIGEIVKHIKLLVDQGYKEVVLTGVDITDYGKDLPFQPNLGEMIKKIFSNVPDLARLRLSSIDVAEIDKDLEDLIKNESKLMPHFHLSLQSGDDIILKRMKRRHNRQQVIDFCDFVKKYRINPAFGADVIVGFPTETEAMFLNSVDLVEKLGFVHLHVFPYSIREGTVAARIPLNRHVKEEVKKARGRILRECGIKQMQKYSKNFLNKKIQILIESDEKGKSEEFLQVNIENIKNKIPGNLVLANVYKVRNNILYCC